MKLFIISLFLLLSFSSSYAFSDIETNWYKQSILELKDSWVVNGFDNGTYLPEDSTSRAELLKIILNTAEIDIVEPEESCFKDISASVWYTKYACTGTDLWIVKWYEDGTFKPNNKLTVIEALAFAARAFDIELWDTPEWEEWFEKYQDFAHKNNIVPIHSYTQERLISRWQAAELLVRMKKHSEGTRLDYKSVWCEMNPGLRSGSYNVEIDWVERNYLLYVPSGMRKWKEMSLAVAFHGRTNNNEQVRDYMQLGGWRYGYKQNDFIVAYPAGVWPGPFSWSQQSNIELFDAIITKVSEELCVNRDAVFTVGHSLGSYMSNKTSCLRWDVVRAMAWVASSGYNGDCTGPAASLITHLEWDPLAGYAGWVWAYNIRSVKNLCDDEERDTRVWDIRSCTQKTSCTTGNTVLFCNEYATYWDDQHSWPKEGSDDILDFFREVEDYSK